MVIFEILLTVASKICRIINCMLRSWALHASSGSKDPSLLFSFSVYIYFCIPTEHFTILESQKRRSTVFDCIEFNNQGFSKFFCREPVLLLISFCYWTSAGCFASYLTDTNASMIDLTIPTEVLTMLRTVFDGKNKQATARRAEIGNPSLIISVYL